MTKKQAESFLRLTLALGLMLGFITIFFIKARDGNFFRLRRTKHKKKRYVRGWRTNISLLKRPRMEIG
jgi:hypothetical protein